MTISGRTAIAVVAALALSLALNFGWLGFTISRSLLPQKRPEVSAERLVSIGARALPPPVRAEVAAALATHRDELQDAFRGVRDARRQVFAAMRADPFDEAALQAAFAQLRERLDDVSAIGEAAITKGVAASSPQMRAGIAPPRGR